MSVGDGAQVPSAGLPPDGADQPEAGRQETTPGPWRRAGRRLRADHAAMGALAFLVLLGVVAVLAAWISPHDPLQTSLRNAHAPLSAEHWLGTDDLGRDVASRLMHGAAVSLRASLQVVATALALALPIGLIAGYAGGPVDNVLMRLTDAVMSVPALILALAIAGTLGPGLTNAMIALTVVFTPTFVRLIRGQTLTVRQETYVEASLSIGTRTRRILATRILPNVVSPLIVQASLVLGGVLLAEAALSFLGFGLQPPRASWGGMLRRAYQAIFTNPWQMVYPGAAIALTVLAFNTLGDGLRDALGVGVRGRAGGARQGLTRAMVPPAPTAQPALGATPEAMPETAAEALLSVRGLRVEFETDSGTLTAVDGAGFNLRRGEVLGLVGESGCGKTVTSLAVMRLVPTPPARITGGDIAYEGRSLLDLGFEEMRALRGPELAMIFQDPMSSLNPAYTVGNQIVESIRLHEDVSRRAARARAEELLGLVGIPAPGARLDQYPHEFSGGMRQRAMIAMALSCEPRVLIADEPTTALDVTVQAQILELLKGLQQELGMSMLFVTHDLGVVADICDRVAVMYAGHVVEHAPVHDLFRSPQHPYTAGLLAAMPQATGKGQELRSIPGRVPMLGELEEGCRFAPRCPYAQPQCLGAPIPLDRVGALAAVRCVRSHELDLEGAR